MNKSKQKKKDIVLIVEDVSANHEVIQTFLDDIDVRSEHACNGIEAVEMCAAAGKGYYSLILMDLHLPQLNGNEAAQQIRSMHIDTPVIAITAASKGDISLRDGGKIFDHILFKPFNYLEFYTAISPYIQNAMAFIKRAGGMFHEPEAILQADDSVCNIHQGISNMGNNPRLFVKHFNNFKKNNVDLALRLQEMVDQQRYADASLLCHSIKGIAGMLALTSLYEHVLQLETELKASSEPGDKSLQGISSLLSSIGDDIRLTCQIQF